MSYPSYPYKKISKKFQFTPENKGLIEKIMSEYPDNYKGGALTQILLLGQSQNKGWLSNAVIESVSEIVGISIPDIKEFVSSYSLFNREPVGENIIRICLATSCRLKGSAHLVRLSEKWLGIKSEETTLDCMFTLKQTDCLGACTACPVIKINNDYHENLTSKKFIQILQTFSEGKKSYFSKDTLHSKSKDLFEC